MRASPSQVALLATIVVAAATTSACDETTSATTTGASTAAVTTGPETGDLFVHGKVTEHGEPKAGARVWVTLTSEDDDIRPGETVDTWNSATVTTGDDGTYAISVDPDQLPSRYFPASDDFLNFELLVAADEALAMWNTTLWLLDQPQVWRTQDSRPGDQVMDMSVDLGDEIIKTTDSQGHVESSDVPVIPVPPSLAVD